MTITTQSNDEKWQNKVTQIQINAASTRHPFRSCSFLKVDIPLGHWQLRDLVKFDSVNHNKILYTKDQGIRSIDSITGMWSLVRNTEFVPKCFAELDGVIVCGGSSDSAKDGLISVNEKTVSVGAEINNNVTCDRYSGNQYGSFVCSNDCHLYSIDISSSRVTRTSNVDLHYPLNHSAISNNQKMVIASGDSPKLTLVSPKSNEIINDVSVDSELKNCGFSVQFHHSDNYFAAAFQLGYTYLFDVRNLSHSIHTFKSTDPGKQAFRHLRFTNYATDDFLFITEHTRRVHVIDMRNFENHKVITYPNDFAESRKPKCSMSPQIEDFDTACLGKSKGYEILGMDWVSDFHGSKMVVGGRDSGVTVWEVDGWNRRRVQEYSVF